MGVILLLLILSCGFADQGAAAAAPRPAPPAQNAKAADPIIILERHSGYWGMSPEYKIVIHADGGVLYVGKKNVATVGEAKGRIPAEELQRLLKAFESVNYFALLGEYGESGNCPTYVTDGPRAYTWVKVGGREKSVLHDDGCRDGGPDGLVYFPKGLTALERLIDSVAGSYRWTGR